MKVFVTGVAGFLGSHLADALLAAGHSVAGCDNLLGGELCNVPADVEFHRSDCADLDAMKAVVEGADVLYHCAATAYEGLSVFSPAFVCHNVFQASVATFTAAFHNRVRRIVFCSSMARYGAGEVPFVESAPTQPQDPYGISKVAAEQVLATLCEVHGVEWVVAVPHNIYGPRQRFDDPYRNVAAIMTNRMLLGRPPVVYGDGRQKRCFSYIDDCVDSLLQMASAPQVVGETINIGPDEEFVEINELAAVLSELLGFTGAPERHPPRPAEVRFANCSAAKARALLGFAPKTRLRDGLSALVADIRARGPRAFRYHLPIELDGPGLPRTWRDRSM